MALGLTSRIPCRKSLKAIVTDPATSTSNGLRRFPSALRNAYKPIKNKTNKQKICRHPPGSHKHKKYGAQAHGSTGKEMMFKQMSPCQALARSKNTQDTSDKRTRKNRISLPQTECKLNLFQKTEWNSLAAVLPEMKLTGQTPNVHTWRWTDF